MAFDKLRFVSTNNKIMIPLFSVLLREATLNQFFKSGFNQRTQIPKLLCSFSVDWLDRELMLTDFPISYGFGDKRNQKGSTKVEFQISTFFLFIPFYCIFGAKYPSFWTTFESLQKMRKWEMGKMRVNGTLFSQLWKKNTIFIFNLILTRLMFFFL